MRQDSGDSSFPLHEVHTPVSMTSEEYQASQDPENGNGTYTYSKFSLPRGREIQRESLNTAELFKQYFGETTANKSRIERPPSPPADIRVIETAPTPSTPSQDMEASFRGMSMDTGTTRPSIGDGSSNATIRPHTSASTPEMTAEEHLERGIKCHEAGSLKESTYHLRLAARANHPTAMLLYALACRHGWGMRANEAEGVMWLRRAVDSAQLEVAEDEELMKAGKSSDPTERRTHKAQFALGIYELGRSYMEGWGIQKDPALGLRCFEIAGSWGDADSLAEAGYCYAQGLGCKKDMKKAARFYRSAEAKGVSMAGNSW
jgi:TPR repeat protein